MYIIIVGDGKVGVAVTAQLVKEGHDLIVIDTNESVLEQSVEEQDVQIIRGDATSVAVLNEAGAAQADLLIAATSSDDTNILTCIYAKRLNTKHTIARVRDLKTAEQIMAIRDQLGLSMTVNPELAAAREAHHLLQFPSFLSRETFAKGRVEIVELKVTADSKLCGIALSKLHKVVAVKVLVCAVEREGQAFIPGGDFVLQDNDTIYVTAASSHLVSLINALGLTRKKIGKAMIIGGGRIAHFLAAMLINNGVKVKIVEKNPNRCIELAGLLPKAMIIQGDGNQKRLLMEEGLREMDALVALTDYDEANIFLSLYAAYIGVPKFITKVSQTEDPEFLRSLGIGSLINPKVQTATEIVRYVRAMAQTVGGSVITLYRLVDGKVQALEFLANENTKHLDLPLEKVPIRKNFLLACIMRRNKPIIPRGNDYIHKDDTVIVVTTSDEAIIDLNEIYEY